MLRAAVARVVAASVAATVKLAVPASVGVPEMTPAEERLKPAGSAPAESVQVYGGKPPLAASAAE